MKIREMKDAIINLKARDKIHILPYLVDTFMGYNCKLQLYKNFITNFMKADKTIIKRVHTKIFKKLEQIKGPPTYEGIGVKREKDFVEIGNKIQALNLSDAEFDLLQQLQISISHLVYKAVAEGIIYHSENILKMGDSPEETGIWYNLFETEHGHVYSDNFAQFMASIIKLFTEYYNYKNPVKNES